MNLGAETFLGRLLRLPLRMIPRRAVLPVLSGINRGRCWRVGSNIHGCWLGRYESDKQGLIKRLVKPGAVAYDIGANAGFYTLALSRLVGESGAVCAFEPLAENASNILDHLWLNGCGNTTFYQVALSDVDGFSAFVVASSNSMGHLGEAGSYRVPTASIDSMIENTGLPSPDIVKMDVEGAESRVLDGARKLLMMRKTIWIIALHGESQREACGRILREYGYRVFSLDGVPISGNVETDEIYALPAAGGRE